MSLTISHRKVLSCTFGVTLALLFINPGRADAEGPSQPELSSPEGKSTVPKIWDDRLLATWALPVAGLNVAPNFVPEREYYAAPIDNLRTYPVYHPDFEPKGYQDRLKQQPPKPLIEPDKLKTEQDWIEAGQRVFDELDVPLVRSDDPKALRYLQDREALKKDRTSVTKDGVILGFRWVVEKPGQVRLTFSECSDCHVRLMPDGTTLRR
jgi:hypothetical protein